MDFKVISSRENPLIKLASSLQRSAKERSERGLFVLEGLRICSDAYENGIKFNKLIVSETASLKYKKEVREYSENSEEAFIIPDGLFLKISDTDNPQGIIALAEKPTVNRKLDKFGKYVGLENLNDPSNLGAVSRTAEALGASGLVLSKGCCDPYSPKSLRASMGTLLRMPVIILNNFSEDIKALGIKTYACVVDSKAKSISDVNFSAGSMIIIGNEANGITQQTVSNSDESITIPMRGRAESLNAAVAASIALWEMMK